MENFINLNLAARSRALEERFSHELKTSSAFPQLTFFQKQRSAITLIAIRESSATHNKAIRGKGRKIPPVVIFHAPISAVVSRYTAYNMCSRKAPSRPQNWLKYAGDADIAFSSFFITFPALFSRGVRAALSTIVGIYRRLEPINERRGKFYLDNRGYHNNNMPIRVSKIDGRFVVVRTRAAHQAHSRQLFARVRGYRCAVCPR